MKNDDELRDLLRIACKERGGQTQFAERAGCSPYCVNDVLHGRKRMSEKIARKLGYERGWVKIKK